jgi:hypothetical protein
MLKVCAINSWLAPFFGDAVDHGCNDYSETAAFYQDMGMGSQHVLDLLLSSAPGSDAHIDSQATSIKLPDVTQWFVERQSLCERHNGISLSDEIHIFGRPQLVNWLVNHSNAEKRKILAEVLINLQRSMLGFKVISERRVAPQGGRDGGLHA